MLGARAGVYCRLHLPGLFPSQDNSMAGPGSEMGLVPLVAPATCPRPSKLRDVESEHVSVVRLPQVLPNQEKQDSIEHWFAVEPRQSCR